MDATKTSVKPWVGLTGLVLSALVLGGCGPSGPETYPVSGTVTWNGQPLPEGHIVFSSEDGSVAPAAGKISDGKFAFRAQAGQKRVEIHADREAGPIDPFMGTVPRKPYIPPRYNSETILTAEVIPTGKNEFTFELREQEVGLGARRNE